MERWQIQLDRYLTEPPDEYYDDDREVGQCEHCRTTLLNGQDVYHDSREEGFTFCDKQCYKEWLYHHIEEELDYFIELLEENKDTYHTTLEVEFDDDEYYGED